MSTLTPTGGTTGTLVVISGRGFGTAQSAGAVTFSGVPALVGCGPPGVSFDRRSQWLIWGSPSTRRGAKALSFKINGKFVPPGTVRVKSKSVLVAWGNMRMKLESYIPVTQILTLGHGM